MEKSLMLHEILEPILSHLSTAQLLQLRSTSQLFRSVASQLCRKREVLLKHPYNATETVHETFLDVSNLPWSSCKFLISSKLYPFSGFEDLPKCLTVFGQHILSIHVVMDIPCYGLLAKIIIYLPVLASVRINDLLPDTGSSKFLFPSAVMSERSKVPLTVRKYGCRIYSEESFAFLKWMLWASNLNTVGVYAEADYVESVMQELSSVKSVFLSLQVDIECLRKIVEISEQNLQNLNQLHLQLAIGKEHVSEYLADVQFFLSKVAPNLERLSFGFRERAVVAGEIEFEKMPKLKLLQFTSCYDQFSLTPPLYILKPFTSDQFPSLHRVVLSSYYKNSINIDLFKSCKFDTVRELVVFEEYSNPMEDDWATVFPNLESLFSAVCLGSFEYILQQMQGLVSLRLRIENHQNTMSELELDVNVLLSGVPNVDDIYKKPKSSQSSTKRGSYSLHSLKNLKRLELSFPEHVCWRPPTSYDERMRKYRLRDSGAYFSLMELQPLDYLCLCNVKISDALNKDLVERHSVYEQLDNDKYRRFYWQDSAYCGDNFELQ